VAGVGGWCAHDFVLCLSFCCTCSSEPPRRMVCTGRARCQGTTEAAGGAQPQASTERVTGVAKRTLAPSAARAMRRIRGGFEGQMQRVENGGQRMERDSRVSHASRTIAREPLGSRAFLGALAPLLSDLRCEKRGVRYCMHVQW
jgi:hypothetical protein